MLNSLFAQRQNLFKPKFVRMLLDIPKFYKNTLADLDAGRLTDEMTLGDYLDNGPYSEWLASKHIIPMVSAIWSTPYMATRKFPMKFLIEFCKRHGLLNVNDRPKWRTITNGTRSYIAPMTAGFKDRIRLSSPVESVRRSDGKVFLTANGREEEFDQVILACHSDESLTILADPSAAEQDILGSIKYLANDVILHTDDSILANEKKAWAAWNYRLTKDRDCLPKLTYNMNILQNIDAPVTLCVTLNDTEVIDPQKILRKFRYSHPQFTEAGVAAQQRWAEINGTNNTWFCGAYWGKGFHEDGVNSALKVVQALGVDW